uniref:Uncharacterized protein n=1 Tax=Anguilla anguilla TaxID=7936 RepID=A0A0E9SQN5_ANGAN
MSPSSSFCMVAVGESILCGCSRLSISHPVLHTSHEGTDERPAVL